jgi:hypothetical protein
MKALLTSLEAAIQLHPRFLLAERAILTLNLVFHYPLKDSLENISILELYLIVLDLNYITLSLPRSNNTRQVIW